MPNYYYIFIMVIGLRAQTQYVHKNTKVQIKAIRKDGGQTARGEIVNQVYTCHVMKNPTAAAKHYVSA